MTRLFLLILTFILFSCKHSIDDNLKSAIKNQPRYEDAIHFKMDSFRFSLGNLSEYYESWKVIEKDYMLSQQELLQSSRSLNDNTLTTQLLQNIDKSQSKIDFLNNLIENLKSSSEVYNVDYYVDYQKPTFNHQGHEKDFLYAKDLKPVLMDIDSLYKISQFSKQNSDSVAILHSLNLNDSLLIAKKNLERELKLKIAGGTTEKTILDYKLRIAKINVAIANNQLKNSSSFRP